VTVVSNSSPLISLGKIEAFNLLKQLYGNVTISAEVYAEVVLSGARLPGSSETSSSSWIQAREVQRPSDVTAAQQRFGLGLGELSTLILAREVGSDLVILDDLGARRLAQREGFRVQGTIGVLEACFRKGYLTELREAFELLLQRGVYLDRALLNLSLESCKLAPI
jgi:predicted nucleic acid-binding protein